MSDLLSEGVVIRMAPQPVLGTDPTLGWVQLQIDKGSLQNWDRKLQTVERKIHDPYMVNRKGRVVGWQVQPQFAHDFNKDLADLVGEAALRCVAAHPGGKGQRVYRPTAVVDGGVAEDSFTVAALGDLPGNTLVKGRGFTSATNNAIFATAADSVAGSIKVATGLLVAEVPPANATLGVWGFQGAAGDITFDGANLNSTVEDFTTRGIAVGSLVQIGDGGAGTTLPVQGIVYAWVTAVALHQVTLARHFVVNGSALAADPAAGKTLRIHTSSMYRNYSISDPNYAKKRLYGEFEMPNAGSDGTTRYVYTKGLAVDKLAIAAPLKQKVTATVSMIGTDATTPVALAARLPNGAGNGTGPGTAFTPLAVQLSDTANDVRFVRLLDAGANLIAKVNNWTLTLQNHVTALECQGTAGAKDHIYGEFNPSLKCEAYFDNSSMIDAASNNDDMSWDAAVDNGEYMFAFSMPRVTLRNPNLKLAANTQAMLDFDAPGYGHETTNQAIVLCVFE